MYIHMAIDMAKYIQPSQKIVGRGRDERETEEGLEGERERMCV